MDQKEFDQMVKQLRQQGLNDEDILNLFRRMLADQKIDLEDFETMVNWMGYELTKEFYQNPFANLPKTK